MSRYSTKPLSERLGLRPYQRLYFEGATLIYLNSLGPSPAGIRFLDAPEGPIDFIHVFVKSRADLESRVPLLAKHLSPRGMLWVSWPKGRALQHTDIGEEAVAKIGTACGLSGVKDCEIDETWTGRKFVFPKKGRPRSTGFAGVTHGAAVDKPDRRERPLASAGAR
ncbi:hypothetical protein [Cohnella rhizosphaerae]|uniref:DUF3052 domain-containing protein n=1 Tax=Cohnella rhizosphaerae TaxID=1457232 RepID=A0A9X4KZJ6_9BACL|nr:hypothetical protein [Cohnella rhizosphaerae]MDG0814189.1 DUF3052 domain-containing protein [Cohnella rhizosphaerae]